MTDQPAPVTTDQWYLSRLCDLLDQQNQILADLRDRHGQRDGETQRPDGTVELPLAEPAVPSALTKPTTPARPLRRGKRGT